MRRALLSLGGIAILAGAAIFIGGKFLKPAAEKAQRQEAVLTGAYDVRLLSCIILEDHELPEGVAPPAVGETDMYVEVVVLYPGRENAPEAQGHYLDRLNGVPDTLLHPIHAESETDTAGTSIRLVFRVKDSFEAARLMLGDKVIFERVLLE